MIFKLENAYKSYGKHEVLKNINLQVKQGEVVSLIGNSGSGKTTLLKCLTLLEDLDKGSLQYLEQDVVKNINGRSIYVKNLSFAKKCFSLVFQNFNLFPHFNVLKNLTDAPIMVLKEDKDEVNKRALELLDKLGLADKKDFYPSQLSGGQKQRVSIGRSLMMRPKIIFFDEPTSALDPEYINEVLDLIKKLKETKISMLIVSHEMSFVKEISDRVIFMDKGEIVEEGPPTQIFEHPLQERTKQFVNARTNY